MVSKLGRQVYQCEINQCQSNCSQGKRESKCIPGVKKCQYQRSQNLVNQISQEDSQCQSHSTYGQIFQEKQPGSLAVFQTQEDVGSQFPAAAGKHKTGGVRYQPAHDAYSGDAGQGHHQGQGFQTVGQFLKFPGEHQPVEGIEQGCGQYCSDKIHQIIPCLASGVPQGKLR